MNKQEFSTVEELEDFVAPLLQEKKWAFDIYQSSTSGKYFVRWIEHKTYTTSEGLPEVDEVWSSSDSLVCVQDMNLEEAKNALRILLKQEREQTDLIKQTLAVIEGDLSEQDVEAEQEYSVYNKNTLH